MISRPPWGRGYEHSCLEVISHWECNHIRDLTPHCHVFNLLFKASSAGISLFVEDQQPASMDLCLACGANSVAYASQQLLSMKRLPRVTIIPMR